jgi:hypothetical protein
MNQKIVKELLKQLQQETQDPKDIGKLNIANVIIWMKKEAYEKNKFLFEYDRSRKQGEEIKAITRELIGLFRV